ncbi:MAG: SlyX family protein [Pseudomonadota bacterium]
MNEADLKTRIDQLEERSAFQEQSIEELSAALTDQWKLIDALKRDVERLSEEVKSVEDNVLQGDQREPPPPHY